MLWGPGTYGRSHATPVPLCSESWAFAALPPMSPSLAPGLKAGGSARSGLPHLSGCIKFSLHLTSVDPAGPAVETGCAEPGAPLTGGKGGKGVQGCSPLPTRVMARTRQLQEKTS